jgi:hypothetical protein
LIEEVLRRLQVFYDIQKEDEVKALIVQARDAVIKISQEEAVEGARECSPAARRNQ